MPGEQRGLSELGLPDRTGEYCRQIPSGVRRRLRHVLSVAPWKQHRPFGICGENPPRQVTIETLQEIGDTRIVSGHISAYVDDPRRSPLSERLKPLSIDVAWLELLAIVRELESRVV